MFRWLTRKPKQRQVQHIGLKPTDSLLITTDQRLNADQRERVAHLVDRFKRGEAPVLVLDSCFHVTVVTRCEDAT